MPKKIDKSINNNSGIYCIENIINGKKYVGRATKLRKRMSQHKSNLNNNKEQCIYLQNAWKKYGENYFSFYVLEYCDINYLNIKEKYWIEKLKTFYKDGNFGYNLTKGGDGLNGYIQTEKTKNKISKSKKNPSIITRIKNSNNVLGIKHKKNSTSDYVGVSFDKKNNKWKSQFEYMQNRYWLGRFSTETEAANAYNKKAIEICGDNARLNNIGGN